MASRLEEALAAARGLLDPYARPVHVYPTRTAPRYQGQPSWPDHATEARAWAALAPMPASAATATGLPIDAQSPSREVRRQLRRRRRCLVELKQNQLRLRVSCPPSLCLVLLGVGHAPKNSHVSTAPLI